MADLGTRYIVVKLIFDGSVQPNSVPGQSNEFEDGSNVKIIKAQSDKNSLSVNANIGIQGGLQPSTASIVIKGLKDDDIHAFSRITTTSGLFLFQNWVEFYAGYAVDANGMPPLVYRGQVIFAGGDFNDKSRPFRIYSQQVAFQQNTLAAPINPKGVVQINTIYQQLAISLGLSYQTSDEATLNKVQGSVKNPVLTGSPIEQLHQLSDDYGYQFKIYNGQLLVAKIGHPFTYNQRPAELSEITPNGNTTTPANANTLTVNMSNGMLGYPTVSQYGITVRTRFNPSITFGIQIEVQSDLKLANGVWYVNGMTHLLQNQESKFETILTLNKTSIFLSN
jgi:hypothetical protein